MAPKPISSRVHELLGFDRVIAHEGNHPPEVGIALQLLGELPLGLCLTSLLQRGKDFFFDRVQHSLRYGRDPEVGRLGRWR